ncbi:MAG: dephospho-CoA kinase [Pseudomonadales bacterium]
MAQFIVGITGGIGSGKTAVSDRFAALDITIVDADLASRAVVEPGQPALRAIAEHFGEHLIDPEGALDRRALRDIVFADPDQRRWLEQLTHPLINQYLVDNLAAATTAYAMLASPLLSETGQSRYCHRVLVVDVPVELQIERTVARDASSAEQVRAIIAAQASREDRLALADDVIVNDQDLAHLDREVARLHQIYLDLAAAEQ